MNRDKKMGKSRERKYGLQDICLIVYNFNIVTESGRNSIVICNLADEYKKRVVFLGILKFICIETDKGIKKK